jgi:hypothetical protein
LPAAAASGSAETAEAVLRVWATDAPLFFKKQEWRSRKFDTLSVYERIDAETDPEKGRLLVAVPMDSSEWTLFFEASAETLRAPAWPSIRNGLFQTCVSRFGYFVASARSATDVSLPAILQY